MEPEVLITFGVTTAEHLSEIYGEVFSKLVCDAVADFMSQKIGESIPRIESLQQAADIIRNNRERYPSGHCAFWYGIGKAESVLQGAAGPACRIYLRDIVKRMTDLDGAEQLVGNSDSTTGALEAFRKVATTMELLDEKSYECSGDANQSELQIRNCPNGDGCRKMISDGIINLGNRKPLCTISLGSAVTAEIVTKVAHEYEILELNPPNCIARVYKL